MAGAGGMPKLTPRQIESPRRTLESGAEPEDARQFAEQAPEATRSPAPGSHDGVREFMRGLAPEKLGALERNPVKRFAIEAPAAPRTTLRWKGPELNDALLKDWCEAMVVATVKQGSPLSKEQIQQLTDGQVSGEMADDLARILWLAMHADAHPLPWNLGGIQELEERYDAAHPVAKIAHLVDSYGGHINAASDLSEFESKGGSDWRVYFKPKIIRYYGTEKLPIGIEISNADFIEGMEDRSLALMALRKLKKAQDAEEDIFPALMVAVKGASTETLIALEQAFSKSSALPPDCHLDISKLSVMQRSAFAEMVLTEGITKFGPNEYFVCDQPYTAMLLLASLGEEGRLVLTSERCRIDVQKCIRSLEEKEDDSSASDIWAEDMAKLTVRKYSNLTGKNLVTVEEVFEAHAKVAGEALEETWRGTIGWLSGSTRTVYSSALKRFDSAKKIFRP
jgi:hypothetical protein